MILLLVLLRNKDKEKNKPHKWYVNCILISITLTLVISAITVFVSGPNSGNITNYLVGFFMFPLIGIITIPNIVKYVKNDTKKWKHIFYNNGNIHNIYSNNYYRVKTSVSFEKKILKEVYKEQIKNILVAIGIMIFVIGFSIYYMMVEHSYSGNIISDIIELRTKRKFGLIFFMMIIFLTFGIPIITYYIANAIKKIKVIKSHSYIAFHAIVSGVHNGKLRI